MAITTLDLAIAGLQPPRSYQKASATAEGAGTFQSLWLTAGYPAAGVAPPLFSAGSGYSCTNATQGAIPFTNPGAGDTNLFKVGAAGSTIGTLIIYDRLWTCTGFGTVVTTAQNVTTPGTIPSRDANGAALGDGVELWGEVYTAPGATGATWTVSYTNQAGTAGRSATYTHPANAETAGQMFPFNTQAGDTGVRAVASFTASVSSGTAGSIGLTLLRRLATIPLTTANVGQVLDFGALGMPRIYNSSCLAGMVMCSTTNTGFIAGEVIWTQG
jgi:hypothetical protein